MIRHASTPRRSNAPSSASRSTCGPSPTTASATGCCATSTQRPARCSPRRPSPTIGFNYLGRYAAPPGAGADDGTDWEVLLDGGGPRSQDPDMPVHHVLDINAHTEDLPDGPSLVTRWTWPGELLAERDVQALADAFTRALRAVAELAERPDAGGWTPSDLPLVSLSQTQIDRLQNKWGGRK
nr:hypothetical protein [Streptomyces sp. BpilaLS-43]